VRRLLLDNHDSFTFNRDELPFDLNCGFVGSFGNELKADCEGDAAHRSSLPDAAFAFADRLIAFDHVERATYVLCPADASHEWECGRWVRGTQRQLVPLPPLEDPPRTQRREPILAPVEHERGLSGALAHA
jgi:anthranilate/para-aminobenzoate synthase component I